MSVCKVLKFILFRLSIPKSLYFNFKYFGIRGLFVFPVLVGKKVEFRTIKGNIKIDKFKLGIIRIGTNDMGNEPKSSTICSIQNSGTMHFKGKCELGVGVRISNHGTLTLGDNTCITASTSVICKEEITLSDNVLVSWDCQIMDCDFHKIFDMDTNEQINKPKKIFIGNHCWICSGVKILKGVQIDPDNVIAANSLITKSIGVSNSIIGSGGKIIRSNINWSN